MKYFISSIVMAALVALSSASPMPQNGDAPNVAGYNSEAYGPASIDAPLDCYGNQTYLGVRRWTDGTHDVDRCVAVCRQYATNNPPCKFVNSYTQQKNGVTYTQHCSLYSAHWNENYATNTGQQRDDSVVTIGNDSYGLWNAIGNWDACEP